MADLKDVSTGAVALESPAFDSVTGNLNVNGTVTADGLTADGKTVVGSSSSNALEIHSNGDTEIAFSYSTKGNIYGKIIGDITQASPLGGEIAFQTATGGSLTERLRITSAGNVGIGTSSPSTTHRLTLDKSTNYGGISLNQSGTQVGQIIQEGGTGNIYIDADSAGTGGSLILRTNSGSERLRIDSSGRVLVGRTSTVGYKLDVLGDVKIERTGTSATHVVFTNANGNVGTISTSGTSTSYNTSSDYRLKENVVADWDATTRLKQLNPVRFNFIADADTTVDGFIAHEVETIVPESITGTKDGMMDEEYTVSAATGDIYTPAIEAVLDEDGNEVTPAVAEVIHSTDVERPEELAEGQQWRETTAAVMGTRSVPNYQGIDQSKLTPLLTKALIEAVETIEALEARITALEAN